jgi:PAS domain S-box-containing protein
LSFPKQTNPQERESAHVLRPEADRKRTQAEGVADERDQGLFEHLPLPAWVVDLETEAFLDVNDAAVRRYRYSRQEFLRMTVNAIRSEEDAARVLGLPSSRSFPDKGVARYHKKDGTIVPVEVISADIQFGGRPARLVIANDIARRREAEQKLALYRRIFTSSNDGIAIIDPNGLYLEQNAAHCQLTGYSDEELKGATPAIHLGEEQMARIVQELANTGRFRGEVISRRKSGETVHVDLSAFTMLDEIGRTVCHVGIKRDITERKRQDAQLRERLNELEALCRLTNTISRLDRLDDIYSAALDSIRLALQTDRAAIVLFDPDGKWRFKAWRGLSEAYRTRLERHESWPQGPRRALWIADVSAIAHGDGIWAAVLEEGIRATAVVPLESQDQVLGQLRLSFNAPHIFTEEQKHLIESIAGHIALAIERKQADDEIRQLNVRLEERSRIAENLIKDAPDPLFVVDLNGKILQVNDAVSQLLGLRPDEMLEQSLARFICAEEVQEFTRALREVVDRGVTRNAKLHPRNTRGEVIPSILNASALQDSDGHVVGAIGILHDMRGYERVVRDLERSQLELQDKILDLQQFEEVVIGRELKMIQLEREIEELRKQLKRQLRPPL